MNEYWISWYSDHEEGGFELYSPWWVTGYAPGPDGDFSDTIFVGAVRAETEEEAWDKIAQSYDSPPPSGVRQRFIEKFDPGEKKPWEHEGGRFSLAEWMVW